MKSLSAEYAKSLLSMMRGITMGVIGEKRMLCVWKGLGLNETKIHTN